MSISAIVPVWNGRELLARLLASLQAQTTPPGECLVVDNGSTDGAPEYAEAAGARVIRMGRNTGFAAAVNRGIGEARGAWIAVLNSDVELEPDYLARLLEADTWFAGGRILSAADPSRIDGTFDVLSRGATSWRVGNGQLDGPAFAEPRDIWSIPWTAALFRAELFRRVGMLEPSFESYLEDVDFGLRCAAHGLSGRYVPAAIARHRGSATLGRWHPDTVRRISRNQLLLLARHYPAVLLRRWWWPILTAQLLWSVVALRHGAAAAYLHGKWQGLAAFRAARHSSRQCDPNVLELLMRGHEEVLHSYQAAGGYDTYWRWYFRLTGGGQD
jgi:GT2 family glycosyltransferase